MAIFISGGSNSLKEAGWVSKFRNAMGPDADIRNISIGAAPSHMGAFRCLSTVDLRRGDTVIWEYGINDANHIYKKQMDEAEFLRAVEWTIKGCLEKGARFVGLIFQPRDVERLEGMSSYRAALRALFDRYGVGYLDVPEVYPGVLGLSRIPAELFRDRMHYDPTNPIVDFIGEEVAKLVRAAPDAGPQPVESERLRFYTTFSGGRLSGFANSVLRTLVWAPGKRGLKGTFVGSGRVVGAVLISTAKGGAMDFETAGQSLRFSAAYREKVFTRPMLKYVSFPSISGRDIRFQAGDAFTLKWATSTEGMLADEGFKKILKGPALKRRQARLVALMTEEAAEG